MDYTKVIHNAWQLTTNSSKLKWLVFAPSFAAVVVFVAEIIWQGGLLSEELGFLEHHFLYKQIGSGVTFMANHNLIVWGVFLVIFVLLFQFLFPSWIQSSLILGIQQKFNFPEKKLSIRRTIRNGFEYFTKLFELNAILAPFAFMSILFYSVTLYRFYHGELFTNIFLPAIIIFFIISVFIAVFTAFAPFYIVCEQTSVSSAIRKSFGLVFMNIGTTLTIIMIMILVNFRIIINVIVVLGVPIGLFFAASFFAKSAWLIAAITGISIIGIALLALSAYLTAIIEVFSTAVWLKTFKNLKEKEDKTCEELGEKPIQSAENISELESQDEESI